MRNIIKQCTILLCLFAILVPVVNAEQAAAESTFSSLMDRRKEQFQASPGYALFPFPYDLPGIGSGLSLVGATMNVAKTYTDVYGLIFSGDVEGAAGGVGDIHLVPRSLILEFGFGSLSKVQITNYSERGMAADKDDYRLIEFNDSEFYGGRMTATFLNRRFELYGAWYEGGAKLDSIRDKDGNLIVEAQDTSLERNHTTIIGTRFDLTDDYADPRKGLRLDITRSSTPSSDTGPDYYVMDYNMTGYLPIGRQSTWVLNVLRSDAVVTQKGETDPAKLQDQQGINCSDPALTPQEQQYCNEVINNTIANNTYGTATSLGGFSRLRSYPQGRYSGAHTQFYGTEIRWNLTDESRPFNIFIMKDIRTAIQLAAFYELGSTADHRSDVGDTWRETYGIGLRMVTASGVVFRGDLAYGHDGFAPNLFIGYPWEI